MVEPRIRHTENQRVLGVRISPPCHLQESLDSNVGAFLRLYNLGVAPTGRAADSVIPKLSAKNHQHRRGYLSILSLLVGKYFIAVFRVKKHNKQ